VHIISFEESRDIVRGVFVHKLTTRATSSVRYLTVTGQVRRIIRAVKPDLLHAHYAAGYGTLGRLARFHPYVLSVWGSDVFDVPTRSPMHRLLIMKNLECADHVCSTSQFMAAHTRHYYAGPITVTPFGVDCRFFRPNSRLPLDSGEFVVGTIRSLEESYGIEYLIRGFALFSSRYRGFRELRLVIGGDGSLKEKLQHLARELGVAQQTRFLGQVPYDNVPELLNSFSVFAAVSVFESFGVGVLEASACGLPVIVSTVGGLREVMVDGVTGIPVPPRDHNVIAEAMQKFIEDEDLRSRMGVAGRNFVLQHYEWHKTAPIMETLYLETMECYPTKRVSG